ncbi:terminase small subunit [Mariprofundus micogutta]|nr:terminase small subunit [Mariprofundus micogutta]
MTGKAPRTIKKRLTEAKLEPVRQEGRTALYGSVDALAALYPQEAAKRPTGSSDIDIDVEKARETKARADGLEIKNAVSRRELVPVGVVEWLVGGVCAKLASGLESLPVKLKRRCPKLNATDLHLIDSEITKWRNEMADMDLDFDEYEGK